MDISSKIDCLDKREVTSSESMNYMVKTGKETTNYLYIKTKIANKKQRAKFSITDITKQVFRKFLKKFDKLPYIGYNRKRFHNELDEACFFIIKRINRQKQSERDVLLRTNFVE